MQLSTEIGRNKQARRSTTAKQQRIPDTALAVCDGTLIVGFIVLEHEKYRVLDRDGHLLGILHNQRDAMRAPPGGTA